MKNTKLIISIATLLMVEAALIYQALSAPDFNDIDRLETIKIYAKPIPGRRGSNSSLRLYDGNENYHLKCDLAKSICEMDGIFDAGPIDISLKRISLFDYVATEALINGEKISAKIDRVEYMAYKTGQWFMTLLLLPFLIFMIFFSKESKPKKIKIF
jgi:hypothetical protein